MTFKKLLAAFVAVFILLSIVSCESRGEPSSNSIEEGTTEAEASEEETTSIISDVSETKKFEPPEYDPKLLDEATEEFLGELLPLYEECIDAIVNYEPTVSGFSSDDDFEKVWRVICIAFYPTPALIETFADCNEPYEFDGKSVTFHFKNADIESHEEAYNAFADIINAGLNTIEEGDGEWAKAARLYRFAHGAMQYGYGSANIYECVTNRRGICGDYAEYLSLLARNAGFETYICGEVGIEGMEHAWSMIKVEGVWYHFDACWGFNETFGMSTETRLDTIWKILVPYMAREDFDEAVTLFGDSWFKESEEFPDCPQDIPESEREKTEHILNGTFE